MACDFCDEFRGGSRNAFMATYRDSMRSRVWLSSTNFAALLSLGQLTVGHTLIVPKRHVLSLGHLVADVHMELTHFKTRVAAGLRRYGVPVWFEHGCVDELTSGGCGIYHAHLHSVPVETDLPDVPVRLMQQFPAKPVVGWSDLTSAAARGRPYLYYENQVGEARIYEVGPLPSQFMRRLIADELGQGRWNWRAAGFEPPLVSAGFDLQAEASQQGF